MCQNIHFPGFKGELPRPTYYLFPENICGLGINYASNHIYYAYTWTEFELKKGLNNIDYCLLCWIDDKGYYYQSYSKNNKMPEIFILVDNCCGHNKNNVIIRFLNMIE